MNLQHTGIRPPGKACKVWILSGGILLSDTLLRKSLCRSTARVCQKHSRLGGCGCIDGARVTTPHVGILRPFRNLWNDSSASVPRLVSVHWRAATAGRTRYDANLTQARAPEIRLSAAEPDTGLGNVETALDSLTDASYSLPSLAGDGLHFFSQSGSYDPHGGLLRPSQGRLGFVKRDPCLDGFRQRLVISFAGECQGAACGFDGFGKPTRLGKGGSQCIEDCRLSRSRQLDRALGKRDSFGAVAQGCLGTGGQHPCRLVQNQHVVRRRPEHLAPVRKRLRSLPSFDAAVVREHGTADRGAGGSDRVAGGR